MSRIREYEISFWRDVIINGEPQEQKMYVFGADSLQTQARAISPKLKRNVNGSNELTFKMYYQYIDNITGDLIDNPYCKDLINEAKIKLKFRNKWYDMIIKGVDKKTSDKTISYTATDLHINELSKNGFGLTLDLKMENNIGTVGELAGKIFEDTDWDIDTSEVIPQTLDETLIKVPVIENILATQLINDKTVAPFELPNQEIPKGAYIYLFYSCCKNSTDRLQFIYVPEGKIKKDQDRIIVNKNSQYYIDGVTYEITPASNKYGIALPNNLYGKVPPTVEISTEYRGRRFVFSQKTLYNKTLDKYVNVYKDKNGQVIHGFSESETIAPIIIQNLVTNNDFKNTTGWQGRYWYDFDAVKAEERKDYDNKGINYNATVETEAIDIVTGNTMLDDIINGTYDSSNEYVSCLNLTFKPCTLPTCKSIVVNSGFYDQRKKFKNFSPKQKFVLLYKPKTPSVQDFEVSVGEVIFDATRSAYNSNFTEGIFLRFLSSKSLIYSTSGEYAGYRCIIAEVPSDYALAESDYKRLKTQIFISPINAEIETSLSFLDFQIFPYYEKDLDTTDSFEIQDKIMLPIDSAETAKVITKYNYFNPELEQNQTALKKEEMVFDTYVDQPRKDLLITYSERAEKIGTVTISKSNYFNAAQKLCETFQCWADFDISHDEEGYVQEKVVRFKNYIGQDSQVGFRYGVNLKDITRKDDSKKIVSKLIVTDNINKHAKNGLCTIARAGSNETGETYIYDFAYYINQGLINLDELIKMFYETDEGCGPDLVHILPNHPGIDKPINCQGYYTRLSLINKKYDELSLHRTKYSEPLMQATANVTTYEAALEAATTGLEDNVAGFRQSAGFEYMDISLAIPEGISPEEVADIEIENERRREVVNSNSVLQNYLTKIAEFTNSVNDYTAKLALAEADAQHYQDCYDGLTRQLEDLLDWKASLNKCFFKKYYRFIQEGTWTDNSQIDDEKYYNDALSVAYNSSMPSVSYTFNTLALEGLAGCEGLVLELADKTFVEDEEYFGYDENGNPYREEVVITEINYSFDEIDKDTYKIQNYKNQFQDLFRAITASVQTVNYTSGAWDNAADFTAATDAQKSSFLRGALNHADTVLSNMGEQSVVWDNKGITITDNLHPNQQLRIIAGGIFLRDQDDERLGWMAGITSEGINAKLITAGQLNTGVIQIMNGDEPYFRWDDHGITAYDFQEHKVGYTTSFNTNKGVRFDRFGIYGYDMTSRRFNVDGLTVKDGQIWHPTKVEEIIDNSLFSLTWQGLCLNLGTGNFLDSSSAKTNYHYSKALLGKTDGILYYSWDEEEWTPNSIKRQPNEEPFVKIFAVGPEVKEVNDQGVTEYKYKENLAIYDDGTLVCNQVKIQGYIRALRGTIAGWEINDTSLFTGNMGQLGSFHMHTSTDSTATGVKIGNSGSKNDWRLTISNNFGVDSEGKLFATDASISGAIAVSEGGTIGGWYIGADSLYTKDRGLGTDKSFHMYASGSAEQKGPAEIIEQWSLGIGEHFGVTNQGVMYCTAGKFGKMEITNNDELVYKTIKLIEVDPDHSSMEGRYEEQLIDLLKLGETGLTFITGFANPLEQTENLYKSPTISFIYHDVVKQQYSTCLEIGGFGDYEKSYSWITTNGTLSISTLSGPGIAFNHYSLSFSTDKNTTKLTLGQDNFDLNYNKVRLFYEPTTTALSVSLQVVGNIVPSNNFGGNLGASDKKWNAIYTNTATISGTLSAQNIKGTSKIYLGDYENNLSKGTLGDGLQLFKQTYTSGEAAYGLVSKGYGVFGSQKVLELVGSSIQLHGFGGGSTTLYINGNEIKLDSSGYVKWK